MKNLQPEIEKIIERNQRVEKDKAWETSWARRAFIALITFVSAFTFLKVVNIEPALLGACVPVGGFLLSQISINPLRKVWEKI